MNITDLIVPLLICFIILFGLIRRVDVFDAFTNGVKDGLVTVKDIFPSLFALVVCVGLFRASGALDMVSEFLRPATDLIGLPDGIAPLFLLRPFSGSGSVALFESILTQFGPDSLAGRMASVVLGGSETTFYTIAVYFAAAKVKKTRHALPGALAGDGTVWIMSFILTTVIFG